MLTWSAEVIFFSDPESLTMGCRPTREGDIMNQGSIWVSIVARADIWPEGHNISHEGYVLERIYRSERGGQYHTKNSTGAIIPNFGHFAIISLMFMKKYETREFSDPILTTKRFPQSVTTEH